MPDENGLGPVEVLREEISTLFAYIQEAKTFDYSDFFMVVNEVVVQIEKIVGVVGPLTAEQKKVSAVTLINEVINIPVMPEWLEAKLIGAAVDAFVAAMNRWLGKGWLAAIVSVGGDNAPAGENPVT